MTLRRAKNFWGRKKGGVLPFVFQIQISAGQTMTLPLHAGDFDFFVDWGDGSSNTITNRLDPNRNHTYTLSGTYNISITGVCTGFSFRNVTAGRLFVRKVLSFGNTGFLGIDFQQCANLNEISGDFIFYGTQLTNFLRQTSVVSIPSGLLNNSPNLTFLQTLAFSTTTLTTIPIDLFDLVSPNITQFDQVFSGCSNLAVNVSDLVDNMDFTSCVSTSRFFNSCTNLTGNGQDLIDKPKAAGYTVGTATNTGSYRTFFNCTGLTDFATIPAAYK
jgi:hypothetical protein